MDVRAEARRLASVATFFVWVGWIAVIYSVIAGVLWWIDLASRESFSILEALGVSLNAIGGPIFLALLVAGLGHYVRLFAMDVDGCLTAGEVIVLNGGEEIKIWNVKDRMGFYMLKCSELPVKLAWITARESLQDAYHKKNDRCRDPDLRVGREKTDQRGRTAHDEQRDEERVLATDDVADTSEEQRSERPDDKPDRECREVSDISEGVVARRIKQRRDDAGKAAEDVEVVPLDHRPDRRCTDDLPDLGL